MVAKDKESNDKDKRVFYLGFCLDGCPDGHPDSGPEFPGNRCWLEVAEVAERPPEHPDGGPDGGPEFPGNSCWLEVAEVAERPLLYPGFCCLILGVTLPCMPPHIYALKMKKLFSMTFYSRFTGGRFISAA